MLDPECISVPDPQHFLRLLSLQMPHLGVSSPAKSAGIDATFHLFDSLRCSVVKCQPSYLFMIASYKYVWLQAILKDIGLIIENGHGYESGGDVFFDISTIKEYGQLSGRKQVQYCTPPPSSVATGGQRCSQL